MFKESVLVYSWNRELSFQLLAKGRELADEIEGVLCSIVIGFEIIDPDEYVRQGADKIFIADDEVLSTFDLEKYEKIILNAVEQASPRIILLGGTKRDKVLSGRIAAALNTGCMTDCFILHFDDDKLIAERLAYGGSMVSTQASTKVPHVVTIPTRAFSKLEPQEREGELINLEIEHTFSRIKIVEQRKKIKGDRGLEEAHIIVSAGRGFKEKSDLKFLEDLAEVLGAKVGCTRPISADMGWVEEWIGISGRKVKPKLYLACGISGTVQHAAGIRDSKIIVSINNKEGANIQHLADYYIVGDLYTVLPALTAVFKGKI
jgi:electron transfer flavoprotein alpha subunit